VQTQKSLKKELTDEFKKRGILAKGKAKIAGTNDDLRPAELEARTAATTWMAGRNHRGTDASTF
jgi:hypothetical protein